MNENSIKGNSTELKCLAAFTDMGSIVSIPFGEDSRYDFIADNGKKLIKIQCKTASPVIENNEVVAIGFKTVRQGRNAGNWERIKYTCQEIDYFATFWNDKCYVVPVNECANEKRLRFIRPRNNQTQGINFAQDYELKEVYDKL